MKVILVVGARPNFMKAAPILRAIADLNRTEKPQITPVLVHTGQHYDAAMSDAFFADLNLPKPDIYLGVGSGSHACQTAEIMKKFESVLENERPDAVIVVGDVNSTLACALVTAKISFDANGTRPLLAHVEAGLRSFDRAMPEECNRVVTDHLSDLLFVTEESGFHNLQKEGIDKERILFVGNTMIDSLFACEKQADNPRILERFGLIAAGTNGSTKTSPYVVLTLHRPANVDDRRLLIEILDGLQEIATRATIVFPMHPRTHKKIQEHELRSYFEFEEGESRRDRPCAKGLIKGIGPLGYLDFLCLVKHASLVVTDSGGIQEETTCLGIPCVTVRENTERPVTIEKGTNVLAGIHSRGIRDAINAQWQRVPKSCRPEKWDGHAAKRITRILLDHHQRRQRSSGQSAGTQPIHSRPAALEVQP